MTLEEAQTLKVGDPILIDYFDRAKRRHLPTLMTIARIEQVGPFINVMPEGLTYYVEHTLIEKPIVLAPAAAIEAPKT